MSNKIKRFYPTKFPGLVANIRGYLLIHQIEPCSAIPKVGMTGNQLRWWMTGAYVGKDRSRHQEEETDAVDDCRSVANAWNGHKISTATAPS
jgi:hypothetical protein